MADQGHTHTQTDRSFDLGCFFAVCSHFEMQRESTEAKWSFKEDFSVVYTDVQGELTVGGVFLRLFITNPGWVLRRPKEFLTELLEKWSQLTSLTSPDVSASQRSQMAAKSRISAKNEIAFQRKNNQSAKKKKSVGGGGGKDPL